MLIGRMQAYRINRTDSTELCHYVRRHLSVLRQLNNAPAPIPAPKGIDTANEDFRHMTHLAYGKTLAHRRNEWIISLSNYHFFLVLGLLTTFLLRSFLLSVLKMGLPGPRECQRH